MLAPLYPVKDKKSRVTINLNEMSDKVLVTVHAPKIKLTKSRITFKTVQELILKIITEDLLMI
jgi:uncharacterized protein YpmS